MTKSEPQVLIGTGEEDFIEVEDSSTEDCNTDDSEEDPTYDILEKTSSSFSKLSLKKSKSRTSKIKDSDRKRKLDFEDVKMPELDEVDEKSFEKVEKIIQAGQLEKLKIDQCKVYLRKHGLRLTGTKDVLIERIREHLGVINGGGEEKYPVSSFVLNCKGDACTRDLVMFEQTVYEMYNIASRSASGPPCGTRVVAGRIVKESYGAAKQQHTFTIEVLWSKGEKPLPPLHPLLIKGRNLYRLKTMRQKWTDEAERSRVLLEKHSRGSLARSSRETRMQEKESRKMLKEQRVMKNKSSTVQKENQNPQPNPLKPNSFQPPIVQTHIPQKPVESAFQPNRILTVINQQTKLPQAVNHFKPQTNNIPQQKIFPIQILNPIVSREWWGNKAEIGRHIHNQPLKSSNSPPRSPMRQQHCKFYAQGRCTYGEKCKFLHDYRTQQSLNAPPRGPLLQFPGKDNPCHVQYVHKQPSTSFNMPPRTPPRYPMRQPHCRLYAANGMCHYGDNCKFLHENRR